MKVRITKGTLTRGTAIEGMVRHSIDNILLQFTTNNCDESEKLSMVVDNVAITLDYADIEKIVKQARKEIEDYSGKDGYIYEDCSRLP